MSGRARRFAPAALLAAIVAALLLPWPREIMLTAFQRRFLYFPIRDFVAAPADFGFEREDVHLRTEDGVALHAWWLAVPGAERTVLFLHGNAGNVSYWVGVAEIFREVGWNTLLLDYRGYGRSEGEPSEQGTYLDAKAAWRYLTVERGIDPSRIVVAGRSLGGGVATWLAEHHPVSGLVLEATFTSVADVAATVMPVPGLRRLVRLGYPSLERMPRLTAPLLVLHGRHDELVPFAHGRSLYEAAAGPKHFVELRGGHNDAFEVSRVDYLAALRAFEGRFGSE